MSTTSLIVLSDLHLTDGLNVLEGFHDQEQYALEGLLQAALPGGSLGHTTSTRLIINGDCFDFLAVPPYPADGYSTPQIALEKLAKIAAVHQPFFSALRGFIDAGGNVTFLPGNHDIELCFAEVRAQVARLLDPDQSRAEHLHFVLDQRYQPFPDVSIEHGNQYDFWNYASVWDAQGKALTPEPERIKLPLGTQYMQRAAYPISLRYPYFDHFDPSLGTTRQIALLSLFDPTLLIESAHKTVKLMSYAHPALQGLKPGEEGIPAVLFAQTVPDFVAFQQDMLAQTPAWAAIEEQLYTQAEREQNQNTALSDYFTLHAALEQSTDTALQAIFQLSDTAIEDGTTRGMQQFLRAHPNLRIAIAGHTHSARNDQLDGGAQIYLNTATWTLRQAPPKPAEITPEIVNWLRAPDPGRFPVQDTTGYVFAWVTAETGQASSARLCVWEGGRAGNYRFLH